MGILRALARLSAEDMSPWSDRWYEPAHGGVVAGQSVTPDTALSISAVWSCVGLIAESVAMLPLSIYTNTPDGGREVVGNHPLQAILHDRPNPQQTAMEFREMLQGHVLLRGNAYAKIVPGPRGPVDSMVPLHPDRVTVEQRPDRSLLYKYRPDGGRPEERYLEDEIFHLRGRSGDGVLGLSVIEAARRSLGVAMAAEAHGASFFGNDSRPGGVLQVAGRLSEGAAQRLRADWEVSHSGVNARRVAVLEEGLEWKQVGLSNEDSQWIEGRAFQVDDIARWFRVPPHMIGSQERATSWGSGIEQMSVGFVVYTLLPWLTRWEQRIGHSLILAPDRFYAKHTVAGLLRGDTTSRYQAYAVGRQWGWLSVNDVRALEEMNPVDGGETRLQPLNMVPLGTDPSEAPPAPSGNGVGAHDDRDLLVLSNGRNGHG